MLCWVLRLCSLHLAASTLPEQFGLELTPLERRRTSEVYQARLQFAWNVFLRWCTMNEYNDQTWTEDLREANKVTTKFVNLIHASGSEKIWVVRHALLALQMQYTHLRYKLQRPLHESSWSSVL